MKKIVSFIFCLILIGSANSAIIYSIDRTIGTASIVGTITTDGTIGSLDISNVLNWNLEIDNGNGQDVVNLLGPLNGVNSELVIESDGFFASNTNLSFNFDDLGFVMIQVIYPFASGSFNGYWCLDGSILNNTSCGTFAPGAEEFGALGSGFVQRYTGIQTIGYVAEVAEPGNIAVLLLSIISIFVTRGRKK